MKNLKSIIALFVLTVFSVNVWGDGIKLTVDDFGYTGTAYSTKEITINEVTFYCNNGSKNSGLCLKASAMLYNKSAIPANIDSIVVSVNKFSSSSSAGFYIKGCNTYDGDFETILENSGNTGKQKANFVGKQYTYFEIDNKSSRTVSFDSIVIYYTTCTPPTTELSISATSTSIALNKTADISTTGGNGGAITYDVTPSTGKVENGIFSATAEGSYKVTAHQNQTAGGVCEQDADVTITVTPIVFDYYVTECCTKWDAPTVEYTTPLAAGGATVTPTITDITHGEASYESSNEAVLTVDNDGTIHPQGAGTAYIIVTWGESTEGDVDYCENQAVSNIITVTGNISVAFDAKGGKGTMDNQSIPLGTPTQLNACDFTKTGYTFQGWDTDPAGATVVYGDKAEVTLSEGCTLYAVWKINTYTVSFEPVIGGSITVNGNVTSPVNVDYNATVTIEMNGINAHFNPATLTYKVGEQDAVDILNDKSFNMPAGNVTLSYSFAEAEFKTITFYNNGQSVVEKKAYIGEAIGALPEQGTMTSCDETSTSFVGWTAEDISEKATTKPAMLTASTVITSESATAYNALWAEGGEAEMPIEIAYWAKQTMTANTAITATRGAQSGATLTSNIALTAGNYSYTYGLTSLNGATGILTISNIDLSSYADQDIALSFVERHSQPGSYAVSYSTGGEYLELETVSSATSVEVAHTISNIPSTAKNIKIEFTATTGALYFGTVKLKALPTESYQFEALTAENTSGWTGEDWNGTYLIAHDNTENSDVLSGYAPAEKSIFNINKSNSIISTNDLDNAFDINYSSANSGYSVQGKGLGKYLSNSYSGSALYVSDETSYHKSIEYNIIHADDTYELYYNTSGKSFKFYENTQQVITLYKLLPTSTNYITTCCTPLPAPENVKADAITDTEATISWNTVGNATGYEYQVNNGDWIENETASVTLTGLSAGTDYSIKVRATDNTGTYCQRGAMSDVKNFTTHYTIAIADDIENGSISCATHAAAEEKVTLTVNPETGYALFQLTANGDPIVLDNNQFTMPAANITLSAVFKNENIHLISYVKNNEEATGTMEDQEFTYGAGDVTLNKNKFEATDYDFLGWATSADGEKVYDDQAVVSDFTNANQVLYAVWQKHQFTVTLNAGTGTVETTSYTEDVHTRIELPAADHCQPDVWAFQGWSETNVFEATSTAPEIVDATNYEVTKNVELYAIYKKGDSQMIGYRIYSYFGGDTKRYISGVPNQQKMPSTTDDANASIFTIDNVDGTSTDIVFQQETPKYLFIDGSDNLTTATNQPTSGNVKKWSVTSTSISSAIGEKKSRKIAGRYNSSSSIYEFKDCGEATEFGKQDGSYTYYAINVEPVIEGAASYHTSPECVSLTWVNEMSGAAPSVTYPGTDGKLVLPAETPASCAPGLYSFVGWTATEIPNYKTSQQEIVTAEMAAPEHATTYYAEFVNTAGNRYRTTCPNPLYAITYHANDGTDANYVAYTELTTSTTPTAEQAGFAKEGATLIGWTLDPNAEEIVYVAPGTELTGINGNREYYAVWVGSIQMSAPVRLTSAMGATAGSATFTLSSQDLGTITTLRFAYRDVDNDTWYRSTSRSNSEFRLCNTNYTLTNAENNVDVTTSGVNFSKDYAIVYTPNSENKMSHYQLVVELMVKNKVMAADTFNLYGRSLPEQFVIAEYRDNQWYALPANINDEAKARAGVAITISGEGLNMGAVVSENELYTLKTYNFDKNKVLFQSVANNGHLWAASGDNTGIKNDAKTISGQNNPYAWILTPTDETLLTYTLGNVNNNRTLAMNGTNFGMYSSFGTNTVYFLPLKTITEKIEVNDGETVSLSEYEVDETTTVIVHAGGILNADKEATIGTLQIERKDGKSGQVFETAALTANNAYFDYTINAQGMKWYDIAVPFTVDRLHGLSFPNGGNFPLNDVLVYDGEARATNGANGSAWQYQDDGDLVPGVGYDIMFATNVTTVRFTKKADAQLNNENEELAVSEFASSNLLDANWNYIANNTLRYVNLGFEKEENENVVAQTYNPEVDSYTAYTQTEATYLVGTPFFVQVAKTDNIVWNTDETYSILRAPAMTMNRVDRFTLEISANGEMTDRLFVSADENARDEYQIGKDVAKMGVSSTIAQMWINNYNTKLCANEAVLTNGQATYQLGVFVPKDGEYTIAITSAPENATLYLTIDGQVVWNLSESAYVANLTKGTHNEFGLLLIANEKVTPTNINGLKGNNKAQKIFKDYNIYILRDAQMYNTQGVKVQ